MIYAINITHIFYYVHNVYLSPIYMDTMSEAINVLCLMSYVLSSGLVVKKVSA